MCPGSNTCETHAARQALIDCMIEKLWRLAPPCNQWEIRLFRRHILQSQYKSLTDAQVGPILPAVL